MAKRVEWHTPLSPGEIKEALGEVVDVVDGLLLLYWPPVYEPGGRPVRGAFNLYGFRVELQTGRPNPFALVCRATVNAEGTGSRVSASFGFARDVKVLYFGGFGLAFASTLVARNGSVRFPLAPDASMLVLLAAVCLALYARWRAGRRERPPLEAFLRRTLKVTAPRPALSRPAASVP